MRSRIAAIQKCSRMRGFDEAFVVKKRLRHFVVRTYRSLQQPEPGTRPEGHATASKVTKSRSVAQLAATAEGTLAFGRGCARYRIW